MENNNQNQFCPETNLVWAILSTLFCCLPLGIVAIVKSTSVERLWREGRHLEAQKAADDAKKYSIWGAISFVIFFVIYLLLLILGAASAAL